MVWELKGEKGPCPKQQAKQGQTKSGVTWFRVSLGVILGYGKGGHYLYDKGKTQGSPDPYSTDPCLV